MDLLITVSNPASGAILAPLLRACVRRDCNWQVFINHRGVELLGDAEIAGLLDAERAIACHDSWLRYGAGGDCPVALGSQTNHSAMAGSAARVVSL